jgi:outer membrane protein OmpA-like peptidoglycan-associated protein
MRFGLGLMLWAMAAAAAPDAGSPKARTNILSVASGAVLVSFTSEYGGWNALYVLDGSPSAGWCSAQGKPLDNAFVVELPQRHRVDAVAIDNTTAQSAFPGISVRHVEVWVSVKSATEGFSQVASGEAQQLSRTELALPKDTQAQWLKLVAKDNWGNAQYSELMELEAFGEPVGPAPARATVDGVYATNYGPLELKQSGTAVTGCYSSGGGQVIGASDGRVLNLQWVQDQGTRSGVAVMVISPHGESLNGLWYEAGQLKGVWFGQRDAQRKPSCALAAKGPVASALDTSGHAILYGLHFDSDSTRISAESDAVLAQVLDVLKKQAELRLRIEGHTDSTNTDEYNQKLSQGRAQAVVDWLVKHGVAPARLSASGFGRTRPVADNATAQGRALNRRVEVAAVQAH